MNDSYPHMRCMEEQLGLTLQEATEVYDFFGAFIVLGESHNVVYDLPLYIAAQVWEGEIIMRILNGNTTNLLPPILKLVADFIYVY
jgi:hypothetical protein